MSHWLMDGPAQWVSLQMNTTMTIYVFSYLHFETKHSTMRGRSGVGPLRIRQITTTGCEVLIGHKSNETWATATEDDGTLGEEAES